MSDIELEPEIPSAPLVPTPGSEKYLTDFVPTISRPSGDVILESADKVRFRVHSVILREASPVFETLLSIPQPQPHPNAEPQIEAFDSPVISLDPESADDIDFILICVYPGSQLPTKIESMQRITRAVGALSACLLERLWIKHDVFQAWVLAVQYGLADIKEKAAKMLIEGRMKVAPSGPEDVHPYLKSIDAFEYARLLSESLPGPVPESAPQPEAPAVISTELMPCASSGGSWLHLDDGDMLIRSSDNVLFRVHSVIVFRTIPSIQEASIPPSDSANIVDVLEMAVAIDWILRAAYPDLTAPPIHRLEDAQSILGAISRLRIAVVMEQIHGALLETLATADPLSIWAMTIDPWHNKLRVAAIRHMIVNNIPVVRARILPTHILRSCSAFDLTVLILTRNGIRKKADTLVKQLAEESWTCRHGKFSNSSSPPLPQPTFAEMVASLGVFNEVPFIIAQMQLDAAARNCSGVAHSSGSCTWKTTKSRYTRAQREIESLLLSIDEVYMTTSRTQ